MFAPLSDGSPHDRTPPRRPPTAPAVFWPIMHDERPPRRRALLLENIHPGAAACLAEAGFEVEIAAGAYRESQLADRIADIDLLGIRSRTHVSEAVLEKSPRLLAVGA